MDHPPAFPGRTWSSGCETYDRMQRQPLRHPVRLPPGYFDGQEREFRGFGMVEQWDAEELGALTSTGDLPAAASPPSMRTPRRMCHPCSRRAGSTPAPPRAPGHLPAGALTGPPLPTGLTEEEEREAQRALKGSMLRQEIYALDHSPLQEHPYSVSELSSMVRLERPAAVTSTRCSPRTRPKPWTVTMSGTPTTHAWCTRGAGGRPVRQRAQVGGYRIRADSALAASAGRRSGPATTPLLTYTEAAVTATIGPTGGGRRGGRDADLPKW